jgi:hypothetical protein
VVELSTMVSPALTLSPTLTLTCPTMPAICQLALPV